MESKRMQQESELRRLEYSETSERSIIAEMRLPTYCQCQDLSIPERKSSMIKIAIALLYSQKVAETYTASAARTSQKAKISSTCVTWSLWYPTVASFIGREWVQWNLIHGSLPASKDSNPYRDRSECESEIKNKTPWTFTEASRFLRGLLVFLFFIG